MSRLLDLEARVEKLEAGVKLIVDWVAEQRRAAAQEASDVKKGPVITKQDQSGERWLFRPITPEEKARHG